MLALTNKYRAFGGQVPIYKMERLHPYILARQSPFSLIYYLVQHSLNHEVCSPFCFGLPGFEPGLRK
jgi:hypothetical protein